MLFPKPFPLKLKIGEDTVDQAVDDASSVGLNEERRRGWEKKKPDRGVNRRSGSGAATVGENEEEGALDGLSSKSKVPLSQRNGHGQGDAGYLSSDLI